MPDSKPPATFISDLRPSRVATVEATVSDLQPGREIETRMAYLLEYATNSRLRKTVNQQRPQMEAWNAFKRADSFGRGGHIETNNPERWTDNLVQRAVVPDSPSPLERWVRNFRNPQHPRGADFISP